MNDSDTANGDRIKKLGKHGLISRLTKDFKIANPGTVTGVGDDAAVLDYKGNQCIVTTDMLTEGIHFNLSYTPLRHLGYKAAVINFSDVYAMNAIPRQLLVSLAVSNRFTLEMIEELYSGIGLACIHYGVDLVGGDTVASASGMTISCTVVGEAEDNQPIYRNGAREHDLICVSGDLGAAYLGLQVLERERLLFEEQQSIQPELLGYDYVLERQLKPEGRSDIIVLLKEIGVQPTAMIDISAGLSTELHEICHASNTGCRVYAEKIPVHSETRRIAREFETEPIIAALHGGEDYELLFTIPVTEHEKIARQQNVSIIGHITKEAQGLKLVTETGSEIALTAQGWNCD